MSKKCGDCEHYSEDFDNWCDEWEYEVQADGETCESYHKKGEAYVNYDHIEKMLKNGDL
jgi:hypothetical protein